MNFKQFSEKSSKFDFFLILSIVVLFTLFFFSCYQRLIHVDDAWLGAQSFWFAKDGVLKSEALRGWENADTQIFFTHKLFVTVGAVFVKLFGYSVYALKSVSALYFFGLIASWIFIAKKMNVSSRSILIFLCLLLVNALVFEYAFVFRPELALAFFALWTYYFIYKYLDLKSPGAILFAGLCGAVAIAHHLNGIIIAGAGCVLFLSQRRFKDFFIFGFICALGFGAFLVDIRSVADLQQMLAQFSNTQDMRGERGLFHYLFNLLDEQRRYLHSPLEISITLLILALIVPHFKNLFWKHRSLIVFLLGMMFWLALMAHGKTSKYLILFLPFVFFLCGQVLAQVKGRYKIFASVVVALYVAVNLNADIGMTLAKDKHQKVYDELAGDIPQGTRILAPMEAVFWAWDRYDLQAIEVYEIHELRGDLAKRSPTYLEWLKRFKTQVILFPQFMRESFGADGDTFGPYVKVKSDEGNGLVRYDYWGEQ